MVDSYLRELRAILDDCGPGEGLAEIERKHFFSGAAAYADGRIFMTLTPAGLALKLPEADCATLIEQGGTALRYFPKAPVKKGYVVLPERVTSDGAALAPWITASIEYCKRLPRPRKARPSKRPRGDAPATDE